MDELLSPANAPFLLALAFIVIIAALEILGLISGLLISGHVDAAIDSSSLSAGSGLLSQGLCWLHLGRLPVLVIIISLLGCFALFGLAGQQLCHLMLGHAGNPLPVGVISALLTLPTVHLLGKWLMPLLPRDDSSALSETEFIGCMAIITGAMALPGKPTECKYTDSYGQTHYFRVEPDAGESFQRGDRVLIITRLSASRFLAEKNPWPGIL